LFIAFAASIIEVLPKRQWPFIYHALKWAFQLDILCVNVCPVANFEASILLGTRTKAMSPKNDILCTVEKFRPVRRPNSAYRVREHLTEDEMTLLLNPLKHNRHGKRDYAIGLIMFRHGLRVSECCDLRWDDIDLKASTIIVRRLKGSRDTTQYLERDEIQALRAIRGDNPGRYVFVSERGDKTRHSLKSA
jgi:integrase